MDIGLPGVDGIEALKQIMKNRPEAAAIMSTAGGTIESAVSAMKAGA
ncbi:MAG: hypothetical protein CME19_00465 [Gemmatimonadetes bacterium]|nr:hypothetical protein [Gemmatimonadota bacterium]